MKTAERDVHLQEITDFKEQYCSALRSYLSQQDERALGRGYELARKALDEGKSLLEIAVWHNEALSQALPADDSVETQRNTLKRASEFLTESLSPYEMAHRGFQDALRALRQMNERLEEQIKGIAYAVHDEAGQLLVAVHLALAELANELPDTQRGQITNIENLLNGVEKELRRYSHELRPTILDDLGWVPAIRFLAEGVSKRANLPIHIEAETSERLPTPVETALYRVVQEALNNTAKHAKATSVWIRMYRNGPMLCCSIRDDGAGFDVQAYQLRRHREGIGLIGMQERLSAIGATLHIDSQPGRGTQLLISVPGEV